MYSLKETICYRLMVVRDKMHDLVKEELSQCGITYGNYVTMLILLEHPGITQAELAALNHKDRNVTGQTIDRLEGKAYVRRIRAPKDRRAYTLFLTPQGEKIVKGYWDRIMESEKQILKMLTKEEQDMFCRALEVLAGEEG